MSQKYLASQALSVLTVKERAAKLAYETKWFTPLFFALFFALSGGIGAIWGLLVNTPHPPMGDLPLYGGAQAILDEHGQVVTRLDTSMINLARPMVSYSFETSDPADSVATFYKNAMEHIYGFLNPTVEASRNGGYIVRGLRMALRDRWVLEIITVTITPVNASQTKVALTFEIREQY